MGHHDHIEPEESFKEYAKFYGLGIATLVASYGLMYLSADEFEWRLWARMFMALAWLIYAVFQLAQWRIFAHAFASYDLIAARFRIYAFIYPFIEIIWGLMYLFDWLPTVRDISVVILMAVGILGIRKSLQTKRMFNCACLGTIIKLPLSKVTLSEDALMGVMALGMLVL